ncbi:MAG TPA: ABC transporter substrate-binding protein [Rhodoblastus sp.]|nr:ABC transporter substrate-binding protein [Rhodoblastus sp.]
MKKLALAFGMSVAAGALAISPALAQFKTQGVSDTEIVVGTHMDLSGPIKSWGIPSSNGAKLAVEQINAAGGINGRKIRYILEDDAYDPKKAVLATQKLIELDKVFSIVSPMGSATTLAPLPIVQAAGITNLFSITAAEFTYAMDPKKPEDRLKFNIFSPYYDQARVGIKYLVETKKPKKSCIIYQDDEMGKNFTDAFKDQLKAMNVPEGTMVSFKRGATDFSSQVARLKADGCDFVSLGSVVRESVAILTAAKKSDYNPIWVAFSPTYVPDLHDLGKDVAENVYGVGQLEIFYEDTATGKVKQYVEDYKKMFGVPPNLQTTAGYNGMMAFAHYAKQCGKDLTTDCLINKMETGEPFQDIFGQAPVKFSKTNHLGAEELLVAQVQKGRWKEIANKQTYK